MHITKINNSTGLLSSLIQIISVMCKKVNITGQEIKAKLRGHNIFYGKNSIPLVTHKTNDPRLYLP